MSVGHLGLTENKKPYTGKRGNNRLDHSYKILSLLDI